MRSHMHPEIISEINSDWSRVVCYLSLVIGHLSLGSKSLKYQQMTKN
ncbi:hypothetical protein FDUTEX481_02903 [Tolypothrix sp. PCC 7601]|nr:hypothetical protein FDUTEX481_02903 [Tolypothrix sp. PCC 7601]